MQNIQITYKLAGDREKENLVLKMIEMNFFKILHIEDFIILI